MSKKIIGIPLLNNIILLQATIIILLCCLKPKIYAENGLQPHAAINNDANTSPDFHDGSSFGLSLDNDNAINHDETNRIDNALINAEKDKDDLSGENAILIHSDTQETPSLIPSWRDRYELGPGDVINLTLFGRPDLSRVGVRIAPDGTINYLQVFDVNVSGQTIDEARITIENALSRYFKNPRVIITPAEISSKRYVMMGKVINRGSFQLDSPITLVEALARSSGFEVGLFEQNTVEMADMDRSFLIRNGLRLPISFKKLFHEGDMSQNVYLEPGDYVYIASGFNNNYYVFGAVYTQGAQSYFPDSTILDAITRRNGYTRKAYLNKVLIVRGSFDEPQTQIVNVMDIMNGKIPDVLIEPNDIIFVSERPFSKAEDILDGAIRAFIQNATTTWINENIPPIIKHQVLPKTNWKAKND